MGVDDNRDAHLSTHPTVHRHCVSQAPKLSCPLLRTDPRGHKGKLGMRREQRRGAVRGTHNTTTSAPNFFLFGKSASPKTAVKKLRGRNRSSLHHLVHFLCNKNLGGYEVLALPLFHSPSPAPSLLNCPLDSGFLSFFPQKTKWEKKEAAKSCYQTLASGLLPAEPLAS